MSSGGTVTLGGIAGRLPVLESSVTARARSFRLCGVRAPS